MTGSGAASTYACPDESGRYGDFGGKFIPETLMPALDELEEEYRAARADPGFGARLEELSKTYAGRPTPLYLARDSHRKGGRDQDLLEEGGPGPHGGAQNQQRAGAGAAGGADGEEADHCGDGCGAARGGVGDDLRDARAGVHRLHGREGRGAAGVERLQDEVAGGGGSER